MTNRECIDRWAEYLIPAVFRAEDVLQKAKPEWKESMIGCFGYVLGILAGLLMALLLAGCTTTKYVPVPEVHHDTVRITQQQRDSIYLHDSIYVQTLTRGDTVFLTTDRWHTQYRDRWSHDTVYQSRTDTIARPYPVEVEVPAELTWWQRLRIDIADIVLGLLAIAGMVWIVRKRFLV